jgi:cobalt-zinc-cadmium efflux system membrane fusion protein
VKTRFSIVCIALLALTGCSSDKPQAASSDRATRIVQTAPVVFRTVSTELTIPATIQPVPERVVHVFAPVSGRLVELRVKPGDNVRAGQAVAVVASSDAASARSDYEKARAQSQRSQSALNRVTLLYQHGAVAVKDLEDAKAQAASDASELERARQRLHLLGLGENQSTDRVNVAAPRTGVVTETSSAPGEFAKSLDASNPLLTIADLGSVWVVGNVYERDLTIVPRGLTVNVTLDAYPGEKWPGKISNVSDVLDPATRTVKLRVVLENPQHKLKPDMFALIHAQRPAAELAVVPTTAVLHDGNVAFVLVQKPENPENKEKNARFERRVIEVQQNGPQETLVRAGLHPGDVVVTANPELLREEAAQ